MPIVRKVIDSNMLQDSRTREFLSRSPHNYVVLPDFVSMEAYKGKTVPKIFLSMGILAEFPKQVVVLKATRRVCALNLGGRGLQQRLIDDEQTRNFEIYVRRLQRAQAGEMHFVRQLLEHGRVADENLERVFNDGSKTRTYLLEESAGYSKAERALVREGASLSTDTVLRVFRSASEIAGELFITHPDVSIVPDSAGELINSYLFRFGLCALLLGLEWRAVGDTQRDLKKVRNDLVDCSVAAYATYFDGLMSRDVMAVRIHRRAKEMLGWLGR